MLVWMAKKVESPYGSVDTLHWAVPGSDYANASTSGTNSDHHQDEVDADTALQVELESAEDQLGAVLWNSNSVALRYLHDHILQDSARAATGASSTPEAAPLHGLHVVELGAGVGCLGVALAMGGAAVAVTDVKELVPLMQHNITRNRRAIRGNSAGLGRCAALEWKWGPSASMNPLKYAKVAAAAATPGSSPASPPSAAALEDAMAAAIRAPSDAFRAVQTFLGSPKVHYVILCDALYGNPKDWPVLLYTLSELLAANPDGCTIVNFCEQRVDNVEGAFLDLLRDENARALDAMADETNGTTSKPDLGADARRELREGLLARVLLEKRGPYRWTFQTEVVAEAASELDMTIRATVIRWEKDPAAEVTTSRIGGNAKGTQRPREETAGETFSEHPSKRTRH